MGPSVTVRRCSPEPACASRQNPLFTGVGGSSFSAMGVKNKAETARAQEKSALLAPHRAAQLAKCVEEIPSPPRAGNIPHCGRQTHTHRATDLLVTSKCSFLSRFVSLKLDVFLSCCPCLVRLQLKPGIKAAWCN